MIWNRSGRVSRSHLIYLGRLLALLAGGLAVALGVELDRTFAVSYSFAFMAAYGGLVALALAAFLWHEPRRHLAAALVVLGLSLVMVRAVDWNSRKPFLRALDQVRIGMTAGEVQQIMGDYLRSPQVGLLDDGTVGYRHTLAGWGDSDVAFVTFRMGRVVTIEFLHD